MNTKLGEGKKTTAALIERIKNLRRGSEAMVVVISSGKHTEIFNVGIAHRDIPLMLREAGGLVESDLGEMAQS